MITIRATALAKSIKQVGLLRKRLADNADGIFRQKLLYLFEAALTVSPQFSGDFVSNWHIATSDLPGYRAWGGKPAAGKEGHLFPLGGVHQAGDSATIDPAMVRARFAVKGITRTTKVHFVNATQLTTDGTHMIGPDGIEKLREVNVIPGGVRIETYIRAIAKDLK